MPTLTAGTPVVVTLGSGQDISVEAPGGVTVAVSIGGAVRQVISGAGVVNDADGSAVTLTADGGSARYDVVSGRLQVSAVPRRQIVATRGRFPGYTETGATDTRHESRVVVAVGPRPVSNLQLVYTNRYSSTGGEKDFMNSGIQAAFQLEASIYQNGRVTPVTFNGALRPTLDIGASLVLSDPVGALMPAGAQLQLRSGAIVAAGANVATAYPTTNNTNKCRSSAGASQVYSSSAFATPAGGSTASIGFGPVCVLGIPDQRHVAAMGWGDSITFGTGETASDASGAYGWFERGLLLVGGATVPSVNVSKSGDTTAGYTQGYSWGRIALLEYVTHAVFAMGTNDFGLGTPLADVQANCQAIWAQAKRMGVRAYHMQLPPRTNSTDGWATLENQTYYSGWEPGGVRDQFNAWLLAEVAAGRLDGVIPAGPAVASASDPNKWDVSAGALTADGLHPNTAGHIRMAGSFNPIAATWSV